MKKNINYKNYKNRKEVWYYIIKRSKIIEILDNKDLEWLR